MVFAAMTVGCASTPKGEAEAPMEQLSGLDARICAEKADVYSTFADFRDQKMAKHKAIQIGEYENK